MISHEVYSYIAIFLSLLRYIDYFYAIYKKEARPHGFSWFIWAILASIGAYAQFKLDGGPSSWIFAFIALTCLLIAISAYFVGEKNITKGDWISFVSSLMAIPVWIITNNPFWALINLIIIDAVSYYPTIRKTWHDPSSEPLMSQLYSGLRYLFTFLAIPSPDFQNSIFPIFLMTMDWGIACIIIFRRKHLKISVFQKRSVFKKGTKKHL